MMSGDSYEQMYLAAILHVRRKQAANCKSSQTVPATLYRTFVSVTISDELKNMVCALLYNLGQLMYAVPA